jgi:hypothetical protein
VRVVCRWSPLAEVLAEPNAADLIRAYADELSPISDPPSPDWDAMAAMEGRGEYRIWACYVEGTLAGYISFLVRPHHNYRGIVAAMDMGHYLSPPYRDTPGRVGLKMWKSAEIALRELGVKYIMVHDGRRSLLPFLLHLGYNPMATLYLKMLDDRDDQPSALTSDAYSV